MRFILQVTLSTNSKMSEFIDKFMSPKCIIGYNSPTTARLVICQFDKNAHPISYMSTRSYRKREICERFQWTFHVDLAFGYFRIRGSWGEGILACLRPEVLKLNRVLCYHGGRGG
jgi:hypothetical protein